MKFTHPRSTSNHSCDLRIWKYQRAIEGPPIGPKYARQDMLTSQDESAQRRETCIAWCKNVNMKTDVEYTLIQIVSLHLSS